MVVAFPLREDTLEIRPGFKGFHARGTEILDGKALAALGATTVDDGAAGTGAHTQTETVLHVTTAVVRLECPLHNLMLPVFLPRLSVAPHESSSTNVL